MSAAADENTRVHFSDCKHNYLWAGPGRVRCPKCGTIIESRLVSNSPSAGTSR